MCLMRTYFVFVVYVESGKVTMKPPLNLEISPGDLVCLIIYYIFITNGYIWQFASVKKRKLFVSQW